MRAFLIVACDKIVRHVAGPHLLVPPVRRILALTALLALLSAGTASAHRLPKNAKLFHPSGSDLKGLARLATDYVEEKGTKYIGAFGQCKKEDPAYNQRGLGWKHVRCYMTTRIGYEFVVTYHVVPSGSFAITVVRTR